jgi:hypothetical protein
MSLILFLISRTVKCGLMLIPKPDNYIEYGTGFAVNVDGYVKDIHGANETGFVTVNKTGSETTYYCDYAYLQAGCLGISAGLDYAGMRGLSI